MNQALVLVGVVLFISVLSLAAIAYWKSKAIKTQPCS